MPNKLANDIHAPRHATAGADPITPAAIGAVPATRTVNGKALSADVVLALADVLAGPMDLAKAPIGSIFAVVKVAANWTWGGTVVTARPSLRSDIHMISVSTDGTVPSWALATDIPLT